MSLEKRCFFSLYGVNQFKTLWIDFAQLFNELKKDVLKGEPVCIYFLSKNVLDRSYKSPQSFTNVSVIVSDSAYLFSCLFLSLFLFTQSKCVNKKDPPIYLIVNDGT